MTSKRKRKRKRWGFCSFRHFNGKPWLSSRCWCSPSFALWTAEVLLHLSLKTSGNVETFKLMVSTELFTICSTFAQRTNAFILPRQTFYPLPFFVDFPIVGTTFSFAHRTAISRKPFIVLNLALQGTHFTVEYLGAFLEFSLNARASIAARKIRGYRDVNFSAWFVLLVIVCALSGFTPRLHHGKLISGLKIRRVLNGSMVCWMAFHWVTEHSAYSEK